MLSLVIPGLSQHLSLFDVNADTYPTVKANFYAFNENGIQQINLTRSDVVLNENRNPQQVVIVTNPVYPSPNSVSVVLSVDVSGSMSGRNMEIAREATSTLVQLIQLDQSECALTSFDQSNYINSDFSNDPLRLSKAINGLQAQGGTNYEEAFNNEHTGALAIAKGGSNKKIIIFLTDGLGDTDPDRIIKEAKKIGVTIYCVTIDMNAPQVLKEIAIETGGVYFENINTAKQAKKAYQKILIEAQELRPSTVEWISARDCEYSKYISFQVPSLQLIDNHALYRITEELHSKLSVSSSKIKFRKIVPGQANDTTITLTAINTDFTILSVTSSNTSFNVVNTSFPLRIVVGKDVPMIVRYQSEVRKYEDAKISFNNDRCEPSVIYVNNGLNKSEDVPLKVVHPNGREVFYAGSDTVINWTGVFPSEAVKLEYSSDSASTWKTITNNAKSLQHEWHIPNVVGDKMLVRSSLNFDTKKSDLEYLYERGSRYGWEYKMSPDGSKILYRDSGEIHILDLITGELLGTIDNHGGYPFFSGYGHKFYSSPGQGEMEVYSMEKFKLIGHVPRFIGPTAPNEEFISLNEDETQYLRQVGNEVQLVKVETGEIIKRMTIPTGKAHSYRTNLVVVDRKWDRICEVWNMDTQSIISSFTTEQNGIARAKITGDKKYLVAGYSRSSNSYNNWKITVFDIETKKEVYSLIADPEGWNSLRDVADKVMICRINKIPHIIDVASGEVIAKVPFSGSDLSLSRDGKFVLTRTPRTGIKMFRFDPNSYGGGAGADISDNTFSIVAPKLVGNSVDFGVVRLGDSKEHIHSILQNPNNVDVAVDSIYLEGGDVSAFSIVSNRGSFKVKGQEIGNVEFRFKPIKLGVNETSIVIQAPYEKITLSLKGEGVERRISLIDQTINLGKVKVGNEKDSLVRAVIKNTSMSTVSISSIEIAGPDRDQFELVSNKKFKLKKNSSRDLNILFKPTIGGKTSTRVRYQSEGEIGVHELVVFAEGIATEEIIPESITLTSDSVSDTHPDSLRVFRASVFDAQTKKLIASTLTRPESVLQNDNGKFEFYTTFDNQIKMLAQSDGYLPEAFTLESDPDRKYEEVNYDFLLTRIIAGETVQLDNVLFVRSKPVLLHESHEQLDMLYIYMTSHPENNIELSGHTDNQGSAKLNQQLSEDRVKTIRDYLIKKGVNKKRISGKGYGQTKPIASNAREETRRLNRRVEFTVVE